MRLPAFALVVTAAVALAGCGDGGKSPRIESPRAEVLSYFPADAPLVALVNSDPAAPSVKSALAIARRVPVLSGLFDRLRMDLLENADFDREIAPLLGNEIAVGAISLAALEREDVLIALVAPDAGKVDDAVDGQDLERTGEYRGATLYRDKGGTVIAARGPVIVVGDRPDAVRGAIDRREDEAGLSERRVTRAFEGFAEGAALRVYGNAAPLLAGERSARQVPWIAALGSFGVAFSADATSARAQLRIDTSDGDLADGDVPIASGEEPPVLAGAEPMLAGIRDLSHVVEYAQRVAGVIDPAAFAAFTVAKGVIRAGTRVDLDRDLVGQLSGDAVVGLDARRQRFALRVRLRDGKAMATTLSRLAPLIPRFIEGAGLSSVEVSPAEEGFYDATRNGKRLAVYGVKDDELLVGNSSPGDLLAGAREARERPVEGARGAFVLRAPAGDFAEMLGLPPIEGLGEATAWISADPQALLAELRVAVP